MLPTGFTKLKADERLKILDRLVKKEGPTAVIRSLTRLRNLTVNVNKTASEVFRRDAGKVKRVYGTTKNPIRMMRKKR